ncbi:predicted protein [Aspergillus terreus NIH2624]|uniref:Phenylacetaldoxime dehydratase n=1 Tax=Aspergillus terreus (strain NIH 2624 / FGSC A1156) TaxID=341663 RepID=Q0CF39_ASPTN|nr:uncharacterized protein ATEG_07695 [Aspergillus terreus NIH2624]EAU31957.1 predicted protein [Aspergillus terreus NIH2624]
MLRAEFNKASPFLLAVFGCQYHGLQPNASKSALASEFNDLIQEASVPVEVMEHDDFELEDCRSKVWMGYWKTPEDYRAWWCSPKVAAFWSKLPDNAGFWRESLRFAHSRVLFETNQKAPNGFAHVGSFEPLVEKTGYWGSYRDRLEDATELDKLSTPIQPPVLPPRKSTKNIRLGRVSMENFPDNLCCVVEGQDYSAMGSVEHDYWMENFHNLTTEWLTTALKAPIEDGVVSARLCHDPQSGSMDKAPAVPFFNAALNAKRKLQLLYFLDLSCMERIGRKYKSHVQLRRKFMQAYGPKGDMEGGDLLLWVDLGVLKADDISAEYIGCHEGTGFLAYVDHPAFQK